VEANEAELAMKDEPIFIAGDVSRQLIVKKFIAIQIF
jgi:hypothetical protein